MLEPRAPTTAPGELTYDLSLSIYATLTLIGVVEAATWKNALDTAAEVALLVLGSCTAVALAHGWSGLVAGQARLRVRAGSRAVLLSLAHVSATFVPAVAVWLVLAAGSLAGLSFETLVGLVLLVLAIMLTGASGWSAHRAGSGFGRSLLWAAGALGIAVLLIEIKTQLG